MLRFMLSLCSLYMLFRHINLSTMDLWEISLIWNEVRPHSNLLWRWTICGLIGFFDYLLIWRGAELWVCVQWECLYICKTWFHSLCHALPWAESPVCLGLWMDMQHCYFFRVAPSKCSSAFSLPHSLATVSI